MTDYQLIIWDIDGTLIDTKDAIFGSVKYACRSLGLPDPPYEALKKFLGPPPGEMYQQTIGLGEKDVYKAVKLHREYGLKYGISDSHIYPGVYDCLNALNAMNMKMAVATLKQQKVAEEILRYHKILRFFDKVIGMNKAESLTKKEIIKSCVVETRSAVSASVMIGDSSYDAVGANEAGVDFLPVLYGYGFEDEKDIVVFSHIGVAKSPRDVLDMVTD